MAKRLGEAGYQVDELVTLDAAYGQNSDKVDRVIPDNVISNHNWFQKDGFLDDWLDNVLGSYGAENERSDGGTEGIENKETEAAHQDVDDAHSDEVSEILVKEVGNG